MVSFCVLRYYRILAFLGSVLPVFGEIFHGFHLYQQLFAPAVAPIPLQVLPFEMKPRKAACLTIASSL